MEAIKNIFTRKVRLYLYGICIAVAAYLVYKGVVKQEELFYLNAIFIAVFGLAAVNVPASDPPRGSVVDKATNG